MDPRERFDDPEDAQRTAIAGAVSALWTAIPGIVVDFNADAVTVTVQPAVKALVTGEQGATQAVALPVLPNVPVVFPRGGGAVLTFPIAPGDECLVVFSARAIDLWWQSGGVQMPNEARQHDLSDGFAIPGPFSQVTKIAGLSTNSVQLRNNAGDTFVDLNPTAKSVTITAPGGLFINADVTHVGDTEQTGAQHSSGDVVAGAISLDTHVHGGVKVGTANTSGPS